MKNKERSAQKKKKREREKSATRRSVPLRIVKTTTAASVRAPHVRMSSLCVYRTQETCLPLTRNYRLTDFFLR